MRLYEIAPEIERIEELVSDDGMLIDGETGELITVEQALAALEMALEEQVENLACLIKNWKAEAEAIASEEKALYDRRKRLEAKVEKRTQTLLSYMLRSDGTSRKVVSARCVVSVRKNAPHTVIDDDVLLPDRYKLRKITVTHDKTGIKAALLAGEAVPGAHLEQSRSVMIK